jgi:cation transport regulator ChaC
MSAPQTSTAILGYGSLVNVASLCRTLPGYEQGDLVPVRVDGWQRVFRLISLGRGKPRMPLGSGQRVAVLDVVPRCGAQLNAVRFEVPAAQLPVLDRRESSYDRIDRVPWRGFFDGTHRGEASIYRSSPAAVLRARAPDRFDEQIAPLAAEGLVSERILPVDDYLALCISGAYAWGRAFGDAFVHSTILGDGRGLLTYGPAARLAEVARASPNR